MQYPYDPAGISDACRDWKPGCIIELYLNPALLAEIPRKELCSPFKTQPVNVCTDSSLSPYTIYIEVKPHAGELI